ncbi:MAG: autotransporter-associated beta strand repeat-containing protein [Sutterella wadsworthensis]
MASADSLDVWSNDISNKALDQRKEEDDKWMTATNDGKDLAYGDIITGKDFVVKDGDDNVTEEERTSHVVGETEKQVLLAAYAERANAIKEKRDNNYAGYKGTLVKKGEGTLIMTGNNSYAGATTVEGGTLLALPNPSAPTTRFLWARRVPLAFSRATTTSSRRRGHLYSTDAQKGELKIEIAEGGTLAIDATSNVVVNSVNFKGNKRVRDHA